MKRFVISALALLVIAGSAAATPLIGRSANISRSFQFFGWLNFGYNQTAVRYDWDDAEWTTEGVTPLSTVSCDVTAAIGLPANLEVDVVAPLAMRSQGTLSSKGVGDLIVYARYGVLQSSLLPVKAALVLGASLPTADKNATPTLGDRTTDIGVAASFVTTSFFGLAAHARVGYWLNGKIPDSDYKVGNMVEYMVVADYAVTKKLMPEFAISGYSRAQSVVEGTPVANSEVSQHVVNVLLLWKPVGSLAIRPKVAFPLTGLSKGGSMAKIYGGLDIWATLP